MASNSYKVERLISLLGLDRHDAEMEAFIEENGSNAVFTVDKEDGADEEYVEFKEQGFGFYFDFNKLVSIFLHSSEKDPSYARYSEHLPMGISFEQSRSELQDIHGIPSQQGGGKAGYFGHVQEWIKYSKEGYSVHVEFSPDSKTAQLVTVSCSGPTTLE